MNSKEKKWSTELFELIYERVDAQIKKYTALQKIGVGPDAGMSIALIIAEVDELIHSANMLLYELNEPSESKNNNNSLFESLLKQTLFNVQQEYIRGYAGWLIDENNIHTPAMSRIKSQQKKLMDLAEEAQISIDAITPVTKAQRQCQHDSQVIAIRILNFAIQLKENPEKEIEEKIPDHALTILRRHAKPNGRYHQEPIWTAIKDLHKQCESFIDNSNEEKSSHSLSDKSISTFIADHRNALTKLSRQFKEGKTELPPLSSDLSSSKSSSFFNHNALCIGATATAGAAICLLINYLISDESPATISPLNL